MIRNFVKRAGLVIFQGAAAFAAAAEPAAEETPPTELEKMEVVGVTPVQGTGVPLAEVPANVQTVTEEELSRTQSLTLTEYMNRYLGSVNVNDVQNNPYQPDVQFRGFSASPLLGLPQGLSVYYNGIRFNEPFGDVLNWDLIPTGAIDTMQLLPGSNPVYGLNTLGGAISVRTKTGFTAPGAELNASYGAWARNSEEITAGWNNGDFGAFIDLHHLDEDGWRDFSPTHINHGLTTLSWRNDTASLDLTLAGANNSLTGNGTVPIELFDLNHEAVFTHPDNTKNRFHLAALAGEGWVDEKIQISGNLYYRRNNTQTFNGDDSDFEACGEDDDGEDESHDEDGDIDSNEEPEAGFICQEEPDGEEELALDVFGNPIPANAALLGATNNMTDTVQKTAGGALQTTLLYDLFGFRNQGIVGGSYDNTDIEFQADTELGRLTPNRSTTQGGVFVEDGHVRLASRRQDLGIFFSDTFSLTDQLALTVSGRYNRTEIDLTDQAGTTLNGDHTFERFNPSAGLTYNYSPAIGFYFGYGASSRAPTPVELTCANPEDPCRLPNAFVSDPPLEQVVARTWEGGLRGRLGRLPGGDLNWTVGAYRTTNDDDIQFISSGVLRGQGFFDNVGETRRQGFELGLFGDFAGWIGDFDRWRLGMNYAYIDATFQDTFIAPSPNNPAALDGTTLVRPGDRIPGIPANILKFSLDANLWERLDVGFDGLFNGDQVFRGDEANLNDTLAGFWVFNLYGEFRINTHVALYGKVQNLFDNTYFTLGTFANAAEVLGPAFDNPRFVAPGAPRAGWFGVKLSL